MKTALVKVTYSIQVEYENDKCLSDYMDSDILVGSSCGRHGCWDATHTHSKNFYKEIVTEKKAVKK